MYFDHKIAEKILPQTLQMPHGIREHEPRRKRWTREECDHLRDAGDLTGRYELIDGDIIDKMGQKPPHASTIVLLTAWLSSVFGNNFLRFQMPIRVSVEDDRYNEPEPDAAVLNKPMNAFFAEHPKPEDVALVVEVSDATRKFDGEIKASLYARAGIVEYWLIDINSRQVIVHRSPKDGSYQNILAYNSLESVSTLALPEEKVQVDELIPKQE